MKKETIERLIQLIKAVSYHEQLLDDETSDHFDILQAEKTIDDLVEELEKLN